jgi:hypothetical protein
MSIRSEDFIMRQVRAVGTMLARILGLRSGGQIEEARVELEDAYGLLLGSQGIARQVDARTAALMLSAPERIAALARLVREEAEQTADAAEALSLRQRALELGIEAAWRDPRDEELRRFVKELVQVVGEERLDAEHRAALQEIVKGDGS